LITLRTLGSVELEESKGREIDSILSQPKRIGLLVYLSCALPRGFHRRDTLIGLFWPELDDNRARNALSQALSFLRSNLPEEVIVSRGAEEVGIAVEAVEVDVHAFATALEDRRWADALDLYRGDFLRGFHLEKAWEFGEWVQGERDRMREAAAGAAWALARELIQSGALVEAERTGQKALALVWSDETPVREFIQSLAGAGDRAAALRFYGKFCEKLKQELSLEPSAETVAVADLVRKDASVPQSGTSSPKSASFPPVPGEPSPAPGSSPSPPRHETPRSSSGSPSPDPTRNGRLSGIRWAVVGGLAVALSAVGMFAMRDWRPPDAPHALLRQLTFDGNVGPASLSPDGEFLAYIVGEDPGKLLVRDLAGGTTLQVSDSIWRLFGLRWSTDGTRIGVSGLQGDRWATYFYPRLGGPPERAPRYVPFFRWSPDGRRLAGWYMDAPTIGGIFVMDPRSGDVDSLSIPGEDKWVVGGDWSPTGDFLVLATNSGGPASNFRILSTADGKEIVSLHDSAGRVFPHWAPSGDALYYLRGDTLYRAAADSARGWLESADRRVWSLEGLTRHLFLTNPYSISADGRRLVYTRTTGYTNFSVVRKGAALPLAPVELTTGTARKFCPSLSPDGTSLAYLAESEEGLDLYVVSTEGGALPRRLTFGGFSSNLCPAWSPSGNELAFGRAVDGHRWLGVIPIAGGPTRILQNAELTGEIAWAPGTRIAYAVRGFGNFHLLDPETGEEQPLVEGDSPFIHQPTFSPDARRVAVYWNRVEGVGLWVISLGDGTQTLFGEPGAEWLPFGWSRDSRRILAREGFEGDFHWVSPLEEGEPERIPQPEYEDLDCLPHDRPGGFVWVCSEVRSFSDAWMIEDFDSREE
jgi:DNA-binding SARP family transcriptional activator/Tol biopolymer transport system component